jgi:hypothetical protein
MEDKRLVIELLFPSAGINGARMEGSGLKIRALAKNPVSCSVVDLGVLEDLLLCKELSLAK